MRKGWLYFSIIIGLAATLVTFTVLALVSDMVVRQGQPLNLLYQSGANPMAFYQYDIGNSLFLLEMIVLLLLEFACGILSFMFTRSADDKTDNGLIASLVTGMMPALAFGIFQLNSWRNSVSQYEAHTYLRPMDPAPGFMAIGLIIILMIVCVAASITGGIVAWVALKRNNG